MVRAIRSKKISHSYPLILFAAIAVVMSFGHASHVDAAAITVNSLSDAAAADGGCTLREAISNANLDSTAGSVDCVAGSGADTINITVAGTISLTQPLPDLSSDMTIDGLGIAQTIINRSASAAEFRIFTKTAGSATISRLTITGGVVHGADGGTGQSAVGGGIRSNAGPLTLDTVQVSSNQVISGFRTQLGGFVSSAIGGGVYSFHDLTLINSAVINNSATGGGSTVFGAISQGGGIAAIGPLTITNSNISHNSSTGGDCSEGRGGDSHGGGVYMLPASQPRLTAEAVITRSTISDNRSTGGKGTRNIPGAVVGGVALGAGIDTGATVTLRLNRSVISNNVVTSGNESFSLGGGIRINPSSHLFASDSLISGNRASGTFGYGGGIANEGDLTITGSTVNGNEATDGGGINAQSETVIDRTTISNNTATGAAGTSGGIDFWGLNLDITNSTISGNVATGKKATAGGMWIGGDEATVVNSTITNNFASGPESASGIILERLLPYSKVSLKNTIVAGGVKNNVIPDVAGRDGFTSQGNNLIGNPGEHSAVFSQPGDQKGTKAAPLDPRLAPLGNYGGNVRTHALLDAGANPSPAIDAGTFSGAPATDQRGAVRFGNVDIGAFEVNPNFVAQLPDGFVGQIYDQTITDEFLGFQYSSTGALPTGTALATPGGGPPMGRPTAVYIFGTPTQAGDYNTFSITASKGQSSTTINYRIVIRE